MKKILLLILFLFLFSLIGCATSQSTTTEDDDQTSSSSGGEKIMIVGGYLTGPGHTFTFSNPNGWVISYDGTASEIVRAWVIKEDLPKEEYPSVEKPPTDVPEVFMYINVWYKREGETFESLVNSYNFLTN